MQKLAAASHNNYIADAKGVHQGVRFGKPRYTPRYRGHRTLKRIAQMVDTMDPKAAFSQGYAKLTALVGDSATHQKANFDAFVEAATTSSKGVESIATIMAASMKAGFERTSGVAKSLMTVKSLQEAVELQADYAKASVAAYIEDLNAMTDVMTETAKTAVKPLSERASAMVSAVQAAA
jgi:phasin family protein